MARYDYQCEACQTTSEVMHGMKESPTIKCPDCGKKMIRLISADFTVKIGHFRSREERMEEEHKKKVKDPERAVRARKKMFGHDSVGDPSMKTDPKHIIRRGKTVAGQQVEVDKKEFVKAAAKDPLLVKKAQDALQKKGKK
jgi:putative FmdB family regulatory protein